MKNPLIEVRIDPTMIETLSPEAVKSGIERRVARAKPGRRKAFTALMLAAALLMSIGVMAFANTFETTPVETSAEPGELIKLYIHTPPMGPWELTDADQLAVMNAVAAAACGEPPLVQQAVAQAIRQGCESTGNDVNTLLAARRYSTKWNEEIPTSVRDAVLRVIDGYQAVDAQLGYCYNPAAQDGSWHESNRTLVCTIGNLKFFD